MRLVKKDKNGNIETICDLNQGEKITQLVDTVIDNPVYDAEQAAVDDSYTVPAQITVPMPELVDNPNYVQALADGYVRDDNAKAPSLPQPIDKLTDFKAQYSAATTDTQRQTIIAKYLGLS